MKKLILAAALLAPLAGSAMAQDSGSTFFGTPEREISTQAPRGALTRPSGHHYERPDAVADEAVRGFTPSFGSNS